MSWDLWTVLALLGVALIFGGFRMLRGPHVLDRALALDFIGIVGVSLVILMAVWLKETRLLDLALLFALVSFVTALAYGRFFWGENKS